MLVARMQCGCVATALLLEDPEGISRFLTEARSEGWRVADELRDSIGAEKCTAHELPKAGGF